MEHLLLKAATTAATDKGTFEAVISTANPDRDGDIVEPAAMVAALTKWAHLDKLVPLAWNHTDEVIGHVDPKSARVDNNEVIVKGWIDQSVPRGEEAWRLVKSGTFSFSFGFLVPKGGATKRPGGRYRISELDVYEISGVPIAPANNDTRVLSFKTADALRREATRVERELEVEQLPAIDPATVAAEAEPEVDVEKELEDVKAQLAEVQEKLKAPPVDPATLRKEAERAAREVEESKLPEDIPAAAATKQADPAPDAPNELQEVKDRLSALEKHLEDLSSKAEEAAKETKASRAVDPLRKQADTVALEVASDGLRPIKTAAAPPPPEPSLTLKDLRKRTRDEMLSVLSGGTTP